MKNQDRCEIRITGFGGQGGILMGKILGTAVAIQHQRHATMIQTYGPETRGSACRVDLILANAAVDYPYLTQPQVLIVLSQDGYAKFRRTLGPRGLLFYDQDLVTLDDADKAAQNEADGVQYFPVPAMSLAEQAGFRVMTNMAMLGACVGATGLIGRSELEATVNKMVPPSTVAANLEALRLGFEHGLKFQGDESADECAAVIRCQTS